MTISHTSIVISFWEMRWPTHSIQQTKKRKCWIRRWWTNSFLKPNRFTDWGRLWQNSTRLEGFCPFHPFVNQVYKARCIGSHRVTCHGAQMDTAFGLVKFSGTPAGKSKRCITNRWSHGRSLDPGFMKNLFLLLIRFANSLDVRSRALASGRCLHSERPSASGLQASASAVGPRRSESRPHC